MITQTQLYWITRLDAIDKLLTGFGIVAILSSIALGFLGSMMINLDEDDTTKSTGRSAIRLIPISGAIAILMFAINAFIPTTKEMAAIVVIPRVANSETVQQLGKGVVDMANQWLIELAPKNGEDVRGE